MGLVTVQGAMQTIGNYDLLDKIAEGGMGAIFRGKDRRTGQVVAIKVMPPHMAANPILLKRFEQEFRAASRLDHPNIVRALDYGDSGSSPFLVMEYVEGESLGQKLEREGRMPETEAIKIIAQVAQGLHRAHKQNLIHRDVKPDNILIRIDGVAKLADLGLVKEADTDLNLTRTGRGLGTPHFMAPEQFRNAKGADIRCDIYSLGATLYMMVTGELPFKSSGPLDAWMKKIQNDLVPPKNLAPDISDRVNWAILRAMSADAEQRPKSCREFIEDLTGHSTRRVPAAAPGGVAQPGYVVSGLPRRRRDQTHTVKGTASAIRRSLQGRAAGRRLQRPRQPDQDGPVRVAARLPGVPRPAHHRRPAAGARIRAQTPSLRRRRPPGRRIASRTTGSGSSVVNATIPVRLPPLPRASRWSRAKRKRRRQRVADVAVAAARRRRLAVAAFFFLPAGWFR